MHSWSVSLPPSLVPLSADGWSPRTCAVRVRDGGICRGFGGDFEGIRGDSGGFGRGSEALGCGRAAESEGKQPEMVLFRCASRALQPGEPGHYIILERRARPRGIWKACCRQRFLEFYGRELKARHFSLCAGECAGGSPRSGRSGRTLAFVSVRGDGRVAMWTPRVGECEAGRPPWSVDARVGDCDGGRQRW